jgi:glutathione synthase/RimK-type ligase-like ATP-grasp enzyme
MEPVGDEDARELLFTTKVVDSSISAECPWMVQHYVSAQKDVTVAFVYDRLFAFELDRKGFVDHVTDWRELPSDSERGDWRPHQLPDTVASGVFGFMNEMGLHFGRLDFLWGTDGYHFLEVNTNGEWAWLDTEGRYGLLQKVIEEISPDTALHAIPFLRFAAADYM